ncbi:MAG: YggS family pyridoxal phosphate-dependent enzyme [Planctomycetes bacterium]|nr:YggS family pyridoxal phosphate-dependent enzyme [Planctomycetota bacterium]
MNRAPHRALAERLATLHERLGRAAVRSGRAPDAVRLVAVTKNVDVSAAAALVELGELELGENRVQALQQKCAALADRVPPPRWHLIGHLQTNKARKALELAGSIHSVDSARLVDTLDRVAAELGARPRIFLEVKSVDSAERSGIEPVALAELFAHARRATHLELAGLMTMAPAPDPGRTAAENSDRARAAFRALATLAAALPCDAFVRGRAELSMGMSSDFEEAVLEGADWVRIGSALFAGVAA